MVYYSAFEPIARIEANENVPQGKVVQLKKELKNNDLWEISRAFSGITFFVYTDEQVKRYEISESRKIWADKYFDILEPYNEFGYFNRDKFNIYLDSKENFDNNYQSNWFYYYKWKKKRHMRLAKKRVQCLNEALCLLLSSVLADSLVLRNPLLHQAPNRYAVLGRMPPI